ncbi:hypothetical protein IMZ38_03910 [Thermosphaera chiliense]|uniref:Uncharacterized protein n=1 Tax=Thermosphaera chiliense TaxID=3402707 RepID=A0A7M1UNZ4_9CREN|nr:hypothetical protein [Thermosphaera aggregans]QOR93806.1 hypothetical protein IMZ38_03910 [Thermosphaera aggregans]
MSPTTLATSPTETRSGCSANQRIMVNWLLALEKSTMLSKSYNSNSFAETSLLAATAI